MADITLSTYNADSREGTVHSSHDADVPALRLSNIGPREHTRIAAIVRAIERAAYVRGAQSVLHDLSEVQIKHSRTTQHENADGGEAV